MPICTASGPIVTSGYLTCEELVELVTDYLDDALTGANRARFEEHIATCPPCHAHLDQMRRTITVLGHLSEDGLPTQATDDLLEAFRGWKADAS